MNSLELPIGGPSTIEEAFADIEESERSIDAGQGSSWESVKEILSERMYSYAG